MIVWWCCGNNECTTITAGVTDHSCVDQGISRLHSSTIFIGFVMFDELLRPSRSFVPVFLGQWVKGFQYSANRKCFVDDCRDLASNQKQIYNTTTKLCYLKANCHHFTLLLCLNMKSWKLELESSDWRGETMKLINVSEEAFVREDNEVTSFLSQRLLYLHQCWEVMIDSVAKAI